MDEEAWQVQSILQRALANGNHAALETASQQAVKWLGRVGISSPKASQVSLLLTQRHFGLIRNGGLMY